MAKKKKGDDDDGKKKKPIIPIVAGVIVALVAVKFFVLKPPPPPTEADIRAQEIAAHKELVAQCKEANGVVPDEQGHSDITDDTAAEGTDETKADDKTKTDETDADKPAEESHESAGLRPQSVDIGDAVLIASTRPRSSGGAAVASVLELDSVTVNLADGRYLKLGLALQLGPGLTAEVAQTEGLGAQALDMALDTLSAKSMKDLLSTDARTQIKQQLGIEVCIAYNANATTVYFTEFVMQ